MSEICERVIEKKLPAEKTQAACEYFLKVWFKKQFKAIGCDADRKELWELVETDLKINALGLAQYCNSPSSSVLLYRQFAVAARKFLNCFDDQNFNETFSSLVFVTKLKTYAQLIESPVQEKKLTKTHLKDVVVLIERISVELHGVRAAIARIRQREPFSQDDVTPMLESLVSVLGELSGSSKALLEALYPESAK
jgi:hypothetical protein